MSRIKWFLMSKYWKLMYAIKTQMENKHRLHLQDCGIILDFESGLILDAEYEPIVSSNEAD